MITGVNHIGIAAPDLEEIRKIYGSILEGIESHEETVEEQKAKILSFDVGGVHLEFLEPTSPDSPIAKFLEKKGPGIHHLALTTDNIEADLSAVREKNLKLIDENPRAGMNNSKIAFLHPKSTGSVLLELCENGRKP